MKRTKFLFWPVVFMTLFLFGWGTNADASITYGKTSPKKSAGGAGDNYRAVRELGISWSYSWWVSPEFFNQVYEYVPMVHKGMDLNNIKKVARDFPGRYWLVFNEPDYYYSDNISATDGAIFYKQVREAIKQADPTAKLIVGGVYYEDLGWLTQFRNEYKRLYGVFPPVEGWHAHLYVGTHNYEKEAWRQAITYWKTWMTNNGGIKEFWLTEFGCLQSDGLSLQIMQDQVPWLESTATWITRYAWYAVWVQLENNPYCNQCRTSLTNADGSLTPLGQRFTTFGQPFTPPTNTITATATAGGTISPSGVIAVPEDGSRTFTITPDPGYTIADVKVNGVSKGALTSKVFNNVFSNKTIEAVFTSGNGYTLTTSKAGVGNGAVTPSPAGPVFSPGTIVTVSATPDNNSLFAGWSGGCTGTSPTCQVTMNANASVTANFNLKPNTYTITATAGTNGSITPSVTVSVSGGGSQVFTITPNNGYVIADVKVNGVSKGGIPSYTFNNVTANQTIAATFVPFGSSQYTLTIQRAGGGSGSVTSNPVAAVFTAGTVVNLMAQPDGQSRFAGWSGDCSGSSATCALTMSGNKAVTAQFNIANNASGAGGNQKGTVIDLNGDGQEDVILFDEAQGKVYAWYLNGPRFEKIEVVRDVPEANWKMVGGGNLRPDGSHNIFWHNEATGKVYAWFMNRAGYLRDQYIRTVEDTRWRMAGIGDFDGDGNVDILWHHQGTGAVYIWFMNGVDFVRDQYVGTVEDIRWQVVGVGDLNGDGKAEILWQHADGGPVYIWYMEGAKWVRDQYVRNVEDLNWKVVGVGKFSDDRKPNIMWRHQDSGEIYIWYLEDGRYLGDSRVNPAGEN